MGKFNKGDVVTIEATVAGDSGNCCGPTYKLNLPQHPGLTTIVDWVEENKLTLKKKAVPPAPAAGTVISYGPLSGYGIYVVLAGGKLTYIEKSYTGDYRTEPGAWSWDTLDHAKVKVLRAA